MFIEHKWKVKYHNFELEEDEEIITDKKEKSSYFISKSTTCVCAAQLHH
jgi:hypothetical protein